MIIKKHIYLSIRILLTLSMFFVGIFFYNNLPNIIPIHWNINGQIDRYSPKNIAIFIFPIITLIMVIILRLSQYIDPKKARYETFKKEWEIMQTVITAFMVYIYFIIIYLSLNQSQKIEPLLFIGMGALFIIIGNYLGKIRQNYMIGFKLPWTIANEDVWNKTNRLGGYMFVIFGIIFLLEAYFLWNSAYVIFLFMLLVIFVPIIYSYLLYKKIKK